MFDYSFLPVLPVEDTVLTAEFESASTHLYHHSGSLQPSTQTVS